MKKLLLKLWLWVLHIVGKLNPKLKKAIAIAVNAVQAVKKVMELKSFDMYKEVLKSLIPGEADDLLIDRLDEALRGYIPKIALKLDIVKDKLGGKTDEEQLMAVFDAFGFATPEQRQQFYSELNAQISKDLSDDNEITWGERVMYGEMYYKSKIQNT